MLTYQTRKLSIWLYCKCWKCWHCLIKTTDSKKSTFKASTSRGIELPQSLKQQDTIIIVKNMALQYIW